MEQKPSLTGFPLRIRPLAWFLGLGLIAALTAIIIFKVATGTVFYYGLLVLMIGGHFFMHGSHAGHGSSQGHQHAAVSNDSELGEKDQVVHPGGER